MPKPPGRLPRPRARAAGAAVEKGSLLARPYYIPFLALALLAAGFGLSLMFLDQSPAIYSLTPQVGGPGEVMAIEGNYFGKDQNVAWVSVAGQRISADAILEWSPHRITLRIPEEIHSGPVQVQTLAGRSKTVGFTNQNQIPRIVRSVESAIPAYLGSAEPASCYPGDPVVLKGQNFGQSAGSLAVVVDGKALTESDIFAWSDAEIGFWMPMHAGPGRVSLHSAAGDSNAVTVGLNSGGASLAAAGDAVRYRLELYYGLKDVKRAPSPAWGSLTAYMPQPPSTLEQDCDRAKTRGADSVGAADGMLSFSVAEPQAGITYQLSGQWTVARQGVRLRVEADPELGYDNYKDLQARYAVPSPLVPSTEASVKAFAEQAAGAEAKPLAKARLVYAAVVSALRYNTDAGLSFAPEALADRAANSFGYANLMVGALRSLGVPARLVEGVLVTDKPKTATHYWVEFFIPSVGWVQADPGLAGMMRAAPRDPALASLVAGVAPAGVQPDWYFGNLDNRRIVLIRGEGLTSLTRLDNNIQKLFQRFVLMQVHAESGGAVESFKLQIDPPEVQRVY